MAFYSPDSDAAREARARAIAERVFGDHYLVESYPELWQREDIMDMLAYAARMALAEAAATQSASP